MDISINFGRTAARATAEQRPLEIVVLGPFAGMNDASIPQRLSVDLDTLDSRLGQLSPQLSFPAHPGSAQVLDFHELAHFHPDALLERWPPCSKVFEQRRRLDRPDEQRSALQEIALLLDRATQPNPEPPREEAEQLSERLLGARPSARPTRAEQALQSLLHDALDGALIAPDTPLLKDARHFAGEQLERTLRDLLHCLPFRALESSWLGLEWLLRRVDPEIAQISLISCPWDNWSALLEPSETASPDLLSTPLHKLLHDHPSLGAPDLVVGLVTIERKLAQLQALAALAAIAGHGGGGCLIHGELDLAGKAPSDALNSPATWSLPEDDASVFWRELQGHPLSQQLQLVTPRFLLRQPFGSRQAIQSTVHRSRRSQAMPAARRTAGATLPCCWRRPWPQTLRGSTACRYRPSMIRRAMTHWPAHSKLCCRSGPLPRLETLACCPCAATDTRTTCWCPDVAVLS